MYYSATVGLENETVTDHHGLALGLTLIVLQGGGTAVAQLQEMVAQVVCLSGPTRYE
jgi:hypothetical protein